MHLGCKMRENAIYTLRGDVLHGIEPLRDLVLQILESYF